MLLRSLHSLQCLVVEWERDRGSWLSRLLSSNVFHQGLGKKGKVLYFSDISQQSYKVVTSTWFRCISGATVHSTTLDFVIWRGKIIWFMSLRQDPHTLPAYTRVHITTVWSKQRWLWGDLGHLFWWLLLGKLQLLVPNIGQVEPGQGCCVEPKCSLYLHSLKHFPFSGPQTIKGEWTFTPTVHKNIHISRLQFFKW